MAGAGYKLFNTGDVLTAAQVNTYLQEQVVMVFASATARTTALSGVLAEGMMSYLQDTNAVEVYNGSAWVSIGSSGDITGVTAGTGISGGGTSGDVTITNSMATAIDAKGDLIVGTGADTFARLAVGATNGHTLQVDSSTATGLKWAAAAGGGKVLQVVEGTSTTETTLTSGTYTDTGLSVSITPSAATSKVLIILAQLLFIENPTNGDDAASNWRLRRDSTTIINSGGGTNLYINAKYSGPNNDLLLLHPQPLLKLDSPNTTSAVTYKTQISVVRGTAIAQYGNGDSVIIAMEIGA